MQNREKILSLVKGKKVFLATHWDADGVTSGALIYHLIKPVAKEVETLSKGETFLINNEDVRGNPDIIICTDIKPGDIDHKKTIYIDHHPWFSEDDKGEEFLHQIFDDKQQSCSLLIWKELFFDTKDPYFVFLILVGYFGDGGNRENIPIELRAQANKYLKHQTKVGEHNLMEKKTSRYKEGYYFEIEKYVSALNTGKRMHWSGDIPLELLKNISCYKPYIYNIHPLAQQLNDYRSQLRNHYDMQVNIHDRKNIQYAVIESDKNIQGVICQRYLKEKPIIIMNKRKGYIMASMRVPENLDFDAGTFLGNFNGKIPTLVGGGHEKAAGVTLKEEHLEEFLNLLDNQ